MSEPSSVKCRNHQHRHGRIASGAPENPAIHLGPFPRPASARRIERLDHLARHQWIRSSSNALHIPFPVDDSFITARISAESSIHQHLDLRTFIFTLATLILLQLYMACHRILIQARCNRPAARLPVRTQPNNSTSPPAWSIANACCNRLRGR